MFAILTKDELMKRVMIKKSLIVLSLEECYCWKILSILKITKIAFLIYVDEKSIRLKLQVVVYYQKQPL